MRTHTCSYGEIRKISVFFGLKKCTLSGAVNYLPVGTVYLFKLIYLWFSGIENVGIM